MSTPERQQDPGEHGYGGTAQGDGDDEEQVPLELPAYPLDDPGEENPVPGGDDDDESPPEQPPNDR